MQKIFSDIPEAIDNVAGLVAKVEKYKLDHDPIMPEIDVVEVAGFLMAYKIYRW